MPGTPRPRRRNARKAPAAASESAAEFQDAGAVAGESTDLRSEPEGAKPEDGIEGWYRVAIDADDSGSYADRPWVRIAVLVAVLGSAMLGMLVVLFAGGYRPPAPDTGFRAPGPRTAPPATASSVPPSGGAAGIVSIEETFDDRPMGTLHAGPWSVTKDRAEVIALPTSVDRSIRISSGRDGRATFACRSLGDASGSRVSVRFDYQMKGPPGAVVTLLTFRAASTDLVSLTVDAPGGTERSWQHVEAALDAIIGTMTWHVTTGGTETGSGDAKVSLGSGRPAQVCLVSPAGLRLGWLAINNLVIEG